jgi:single-strand DNA-binding protein
MIKFNCTLDNVFAGHDATLRTVGETQVASVSVAGNFPTKNSKETGESRTEWFQLEFWGKQASVAEQMIKKGYKIHATCDSMKQQTWTDREGKERHTLSLRVVPMTWGAVAPKPKVEEAQGGALAALANQLAILQKQLAVMTAGKTEAISGNPFIEWPQEDHEDIPF